MTIAKDERERIVFEMFARSIGLYVDGASIESRISPEPDILFSPSKAAPKAFELVEILDREYSNLFQRQLDTKQACNDFLDGLPATDKAQFKQKYSNADIFLSFRNDLTSRRRKSALPRIFEELLRLSEGVSGTIFNDGGALDSVLEYATINRGRFVGPMFDASSVVRVGDPTVDAIQSKMTKTYKTRYDVSLLAYIETNPMFPDDVWLASLAVYLEELDDACQFASIFVYDCASGEVKRAWHRDV